jgi:hypothetical protein
VTEVRGLPVVTFNAVGAMPTNRRPLARRILNAVKARGDLLIGCECDDLEPDDLHEILGDGWWWRHRQRDERDGGLLAGRRSRTRVSNVRSVFGAPASPVNAQRDVLRGDVLVDEDWSLDGVTAMHVPRWREGGRPAALAMVNNTRNLGGDLLGGDFNIRNTTVRGHYPGRIVRSAEVMHIVGAAHLKLGPARPFDLLHGTNSDDHPALRVVVSPR